MGNRDFVEYHLREALLAAVAELNGDEDLSRYLRARVRSRLISMSAEELWELAKLTASPPKRPVELVYKEVKQAKEELLATAIEWINDLQREEDSNDKAWMRAVEAGADFYLKQPFSHRELVARVKAIPRRYKKVARLSEEIKYGQVIGR